MNVLKIVFWYLLLNSDFLIAQSLQLRKITKLPSQLSETSGIVNIEEFKFWSHNDSGNEPAIIEIDTFGNILRKIFIKNAANTDWEDITSDEDSNIYIGDFGNNSNNRKDLKILKIENPNNYTQDSVNAEIIEFYYSNQSEFPPSENHKNFDAEAMIYFKNNIYIFTKNYTNPFTGYTYMYKLPSKAGKFKAELVDSFKTGDGLKELWWVTSATLSPDFTKLVLLSTDKIFVFYDFNNDDFFKGKTKILDLGFVSQKEAVCFVNYEDLYITDEYNQIFDGMNLYKASLSKVFNNTKIGQLKNLTTFINVGEIDSGIKIWLIDNTQNIELKLTDLNGKVIDKTILNSSNPSKDFIIPKGFYCLILSEKSGYQHMKLVKY